MDYINELKKILSELDTYSGIPSLDIPDIDLYMDQVTTFFDKKLEAFKRDADDKILTKTMINNYIKARILPPPHNKKYSKQHMMLFAIVYQLKQTLSIQDIEYLLKSINQLFVESENNKNLNLVNKIYEAFYNIEINESQLFVDSFNVEIEKLSDLFLEGLNKDQNSEDISKSNLFLLVVQLVIQANLRKYFAERIIDYLIITSKDDKKNKSSKDKKENTDKKQRSE